jgi:hypothetical protein
MMNIILIFFLRMSLMAEAAVVVVSKEKIFLQLTAVANQRIADIDYEQQR